MITIFDVSGMEIPDSCHLNEELMRLLRNLVDDVDEDDLKFILPKLMALKLGIKSSYHLDTLNNRFNKPYPFCELIIAIVDEFDVLC